MSDTTAVTKDTAPPVAVVRPTIGDDDPRAARYREDYEQRMAAEAELTNDNTEAQLAAKDQYDQAVAAQAAAREKVEEAQAELAEADAALLKWGNEHTRLGDPRLLPLSPAETLCPGEPTTLMVFPHDVTLQHRVEKVGVRSATFHEGIQEVPESVQDHPWLVSCGVLPYSGAKVDHPVRTRRVVGKSRTEDGGTEK